MRAVCAADERWQGRQIAAPFLWRALYMLLWFLYLPFSLLFAVLCYLTNPIVVLFCDRDGELHGLWHLWQTWDNSLDCSDIKHIAPSFLLYDWDKHYREYEGITNYWETVRRPRWYTVCINNEWTLWERFQRYICRVYWLTRNCSYGFAFYIFGADVSPMLEIQRSEHTIFVREIFGGNIGGAFMYKNDAPIFSIGKWTVYWKNFLGWKIDESAKVTTHAMIANRIAFYFEKEKEC
jgi:hypothetical protein